MQVQDAACFLPLDSPPELGRRGSGCGGDEVSKMPGPVGHTRGPARGRVQKRGRTVREGTQVEEMGSRGGEARAVVFLLRRRCVRSLLDPMRP